MQHMKIIKSLIIALFAATVVSCGEDYLTTNPTDVATGDAMNELAKNNPDKLVTIVEPLLKGLYADFQTKSGTDGQYQHCDYGFQSFFLMSDIMSDDMALHVNGWFKFDHLFDYRDEPYVRTFGYWNFFYTMVNNANAIIEKIPDESLDAELHAIKGQALTFRALSYSYLIQMYQQTYKGNENQPGVPLIITTSEGESRRGRVPVADVYDQIEKDYLKAINFLDGWDRGTDKGRIDKSVAQGLLSRTYLVMNEWQKAIDMAKAARSGYSLMNTTEIATDGFNEINNKEWMWGMDVTTANDNILGFASFSSWICTTGIGYGGKSGYYIKMDAKLYSNFSSTDARLAQFVSPEDATAVYPPYTNLKFKYAASWMADNVFMRVSEMYLTEAEALAHLNKGTEAAIVLKDLMVNRDPSWNKASVTVDDVYTQRRLELWGEGFALYDHLRLKKGVDRTYAGSNYFDAAKLKIEAGDWKFLYQIPLREIQENESISEADQNP